jgi:hypothetical protein
LEISYLFTVDENGSDEGADGVDGFSEEGGAIADTAPVAETSGLVVKLRDEFLHRCSVDL